MGCARRHFPCGVTWWFFLQRRRQPFLLMGWAWFVVTLLPVIGLVQVGIQAMADRYSYIPSVGVLILVSWGVYELLRRWRYHVLILSLAGSLTAVSSLLVARQQISYWQNSAKPSFIMRLTSPMTTKSRFINLGIFAYLDRNAVDAAIADFTQAIQLKPSSAEAHNNLGGNALMKKGPNCRRHYRVQGSHEMGADVARIPITTSPLLLVAAGQTNAALTLHPSGSFHPAQRRLPEAHNNLGQLLEGMGQTNDAIAQYQEVIRLKPDFMTPTIVMAARWPSGARPTLPSASSRKPCAWNRRMPKFTSRSPIRSLKRIS